MNSIRSDVVKCEDSHGDMDAFFLLGEWSVCDFASTDLRSSDLELAERGDNEAPYWLELFQSKSLFRELLDLSQFDHLYGNCVFFRVCPLTTIGF